MFEMANQLFPDLRRFRADYREREWQRTRNLARAELLRRFISPQGKGAELGVHKGYFSPVLLAHLAPEVLYLIDPWYLQGKQWSWGDGNRKVMDALTRILRNMEDELVSGKVVLLIDHDLQALSRMPDGHLDWVYLDTTHQYEQTVQELQLLRSKVKTGGIIAGDDWQIDPNHRHHGVCRAVREFTDRGGCELLCADQESMQWAVRLK
jgi:hypothetical protein